MSERKCRVCDEVLVPTGFGYRHQEPTRVYGHAAAYDEPPLSERLAALRAKRDTP